MKKAQATKNSKNKIQILKNTIQEQNFCIMYCSVFLLQNPFQIFSETNSCKKFSTEYNCEINLLCLNNHSINNSILDYLSTLQAGAKSGDDDGG